MLFGWFWNRTENGSAEKCSISVFDVFQLSAKTIPNSLPNKRVCYWMLFDATEQNKVFCLNAVNNSFK